MSASATPAARPQPKVLSCTNCRVRKCKCDKKQPICDQCAKSGIDCVYPSRKPTRRAPRPRQNELLDRISRLESIVGRVDPQKLKQLDDALTASDKDASIQATAATTSSDGKASSTTPASASASGSAPQRGREGSQSVGSTSGVGSPESDPQQRYLSSEFWGILSQEVEGIKHVLDQPSDDGDDDDGDYEDSPESFDFSPAPAGAPIISGFILGNPNYTEKEPLVHPPREWIHSLWRFFLSNVEPLLKFPHHPTFAQQISAFADAGAKQPLSAATNALFFCVYFAGVTSTRPEICQRELGQPRDALMQRFRMSAERALAAADYLNATDLATLQAFAIYVTMIRGQSRDRSCWALTALLIRLAQASNLHRDGDGRRFSPYEAEMRRRLWHFIVVLDIRGAEDRGTPAILSTPTANTVMPTPIDDYSFSPQSTERLVPKEGTPDNVIPLCTARCSGVFGLLLHPQEKAKDGPGNDGGDATGGNRTEDLIVVEARRLEETFIHRVDSNKIASLYASEVARMVILKVWLSMQYPYTAQAAIVQPRVSRQTMLRTAVSIMEISERMSSPPLGTHFAWWTATYPQWHPLAVTLAELCVQTEGELVDWAWSVVDRVFPQWRDLIADNSSGTLWRPIRKLMRKAKAARAGAMMKDLKLGEPRMAPMVDPLLQQQQIIPSQATMDMPPSLAGSAPPSVTMGYDSMNLDPSYLFDYPPELLELSFDQMVGMEAPATTPWTEFLNDTQMDDSTESSGGGDFL